MIGAKLKWVFWGASILTFGSGFFLWGSKAFFEAGHFFRTFSLKTHVISLPIWLLTLGMMIAAHVGPMRQASIRVGKRTGEIFICATLALVISGTLIQVLSDAGIVPTLHKWVGLGVVLFLISHIFLVRSHASAREMK